MCFLVYLSQCVFEKKRHFAIYEPVPPLYQAGMITRGNIRYKNKNSFLILILKRMEEYLLGLQ